MAAAEGCPTLSYDAADSAFVVVLVLVLVPYKIPIYEDEHEDEDERIKSDRMHPPYSPVFICHLSAVF